MTYLLWCSASAQMSNQVTTTFSSGTLTAVTIDDGHRMFPKFLTIFKFLPLYPPITSEEHVTLVQDTNLEYDYASFDQTDKHK